MWYPTTIVTPPEAEPLTANDAKAQSRINFDDDDAYLDIIISAARDHVEHYCNTLLSTQTVTMQCDTFDDLARLPEAPTQSVASVTYIDADGTSQTLDTSVYQLRASGLESAILLQFAQNWPPTQAGSLITVTAVVGYEALPPAVKYAMLLYIAEAYEQRENTDITSARLTPGTFWLAGWTAFDTLLSNFRRGA